MPCRSWPHSSTTCLAMMAVIMVPWSCWSIILSLMLLSQSTEVCDVVAFRVYCFALHFSGMTSSRIWLQGLMMTLTTWRNAGNGPGVWLAVCSYVIMSVCVLRCWLLHMQALEVHLILKCQPCSKSVCKHWCCVSGLFVSGAVFAYKGAMCDGGL